MRLLTPTTVNNLSRRGGAIWASETADPQFIYEVPAGHQGFILFYLKKRIGSLLPRLYLDDGGGFREENSITLQALDRAIYHVPLQRFPTVRRIRFDPAITMTEFYFRAFHTKSSILTGLGFFFLNEDLADTKQLTHRNPNENKFWRILRDAPQFFEWIKTSESLYSRSRSETTEQFFLGMVNQAKHEFGEVVLAAEEVRISFVAPTYNTKPSFLKDLVASFLDQRCGCAELILSDDGSSSRETLETLRDLETISPSIIVVFNERNGGVAQATNSGVACAQGAWVSFIDHDDAFAPFALHAILAAMDAFPDALMFYTDEYVANESLKIVDVFCKPAFDSVLLSGVNYINHLVIYQKSEVDRLGGFRSAFDGSQDYDLLLRMIAGARKDAIVHIPYPAYIWRRSNETFSVRFLENATTRARAAIKEAYAAKGQEIEVGPALELSLHRIQFKAPQLKLVSIIIPNKDAFNFMSRLLRQLVEKTHYKNIEIIVVDNGSTDADVLKLYDTMAARYKFVEIVMDRYDFNFSRMCNIGARRARGDILLFLNNDIEIIDAGWLAEMVACLHYSDTGIVGAKLLYPDRTIQHGGVIVGLGAAAGHWYNGAPDMEPGPMGRLWVRQSLSAVTAACLLATRGCYDASGGFDEEVFPIAYSDVDFCLKAVEAGFRIVWTPFVRLIHHESQSRGLDDLPENQERFGKDKLALQTRYGTDVYVDYAYTPLYGRWMSIPTLHTPNELPRGRPNRLD